MTLWQEVPLSEIAHLSWGDTSTTKARYTEDGFTAYSASGPDGLLPYFDHEDDAVVISAIGAKCGKTWYARGKWSCIKNTMWMRALPGAAETGFLYYSTRRRDFWPRRGAAQPFISLGDARESRIPLPAIQVQRRITAALAAFDELIETNERRVEILEELARSIYREWFVRFRFPRHTDDDARAAMLQTGPAGWASRRIDEIARLCRSSIDPTTRPDVWFEHYSLPAFDAGALPTIERGESIRSNKYSLNGECVLLAKLNPRIRRVWFAPVDSGSAIASSEFLPWTGVRVSNAWLWALFSDDDYRGRLTGAAGGTSTSHQRVKPDDVCGHQVWLPDSALLCAFDAVAEPALRMAALLRRQNRALSATRDLLLPRLVTGRLDISDIDLGDLLAPEAA